MTQLEPPRLPTIDPPPKIPVKLRPWLPATRWGFRFIFVYWAVYCLPDFVLEWFWDWAVDLAGRLVFQVEARRIQRTGSGDTTYDYVLTFCTALLALGGMLVWTVLDRGREQYTRLADGLRSGLRFVLAYWMLTYGIIKFPGTASQFGVVDVWRLEEPYGDSSPMGLLWTFMAVSPAYTAFSGAAECLGGILLLFRRTATLGGLVSAAVMVNIVLLNFCYDVPVKLFSTHLLLMAVSILFFDRRRFLNFFVLNRPAAPGEWIPHAEPSANLVRAVLKWTAVGCLLVWNFGRLAMIVAQDRSAGANVPGWYGYYRVVRFERDGIEVPLQSSDDTRWKVVWIARPRFSTSGEPMDQLVFWTAGKTTGQFNYDLDEKQQRLADRPASKDPRKEQHEFECRYTLQGNDLKEIEVRLLNCQISATLKRIRREDYLLVNRGFHWINEYPFNR